MRNVEMGLFVKKDPIEFALGIFQFVAMLAILWFFSEAFLSTNSGSALESFVDYLIQGLSDYWAGVIGA